MEKMEERAQIASNERLQLELAGFLDAKNPWEGALHSHPFWELICLASGEGVYEFSDGSRQEVRAPQVFLIKPELGHKFSAASASRVSMLYALFSKTPLKPNGLPAFFSLGAPTPCLLELAAKISKIKPAGRGEALKAAEGKIFEAVFDASSKLPASDAREIPGSNSRQEILIEKLQDYFASHLRENLSVEALGRAFYLSPHYLADLFKEATGLSPKSYHHAMRMREAERLLREERLSVGETAQRLGFESAHYFSRRYKAFFGYPPKGAVARASVKSR